MAGEIWMMNPDGSSRTKVGATNVGAESTGILDISSLVGYLPGSVVLTNNQGSPSSMSLLINPDATLALPNPIISGTVRQGGIALEGVLLVADGEGSRDTTDAAGTYSISVPMGWSGSISPALPNYDMVPESRAYTNVVGDMQGENYEATFNPDLVAPLPDPLTFSTPPTALSFESLTMAANLAADPNGPVEYFFECLNNPSASSGWQESPTYVATGLADQTLYTFTVRARDSVLNEGASSAAASASTEALPPEVRAIGAWQDGDLAGYSHPAPEGSDRVLVVFCHAQATAPATDFTSVSYGGQPLTQVVERLQNQGSNFSASSEIWILSEEHIQLASGSLITATTSGAAETRRLSSIFYAAVDQNDPIGATGTAGENANNTQTLTVDISGGELGIGDLVIANNTVRNDQNGDTSWTWQNGFAQRGSYSPPGAPYLAYSNADLVAAGTSETASVIIMNNGVGALSVAALNHATAPAAVCGDGIVGVGEQCDDGGLVNNDCCSDACQYESVSTICRAAGWHL